MRHCNNAVFAAFFALASLTLGAQGALAPPTDAQAGSGTAFMPVLVTDHHDQPIPGLGKDNFRIFENDRPQEIVSVLKREEPLSIGIILDLSGSMLSKFNSMAQLILRFVQKANPSDEFFLIGFNDQVGLIQDFTNSAEDIQARLANIRIGGNSALRDAIYSGIAKMKDARDGHKTLLVLSDGGENRSRHMEGELRAKAREADVEIYSIGIFDPYAAAPEERTGPQLLNDLSEETGGWLFKVDDIAEMGDIAEKISTELRNQYMIGYRPKDLTRDGKWRKVKVRVNPPQGLPPLTVHARTGYYAPLQ
jgi:Ca-activated chloride channel family protein